MPIRPRWRRRCRCFGEEKVAGRRIAVLGTMRELGEAAATSTPRSRRRSRPPMSIMRSSSATRWRRSQKPLAATVEMAHVADAAAALPLARAAIGPGDAMLDQGIELHRTCRPRRGAGGRETLMFFWIAQQLGFPGVLQPLPLHHLPRRRGDGDRLVHRPADRPEVHRLAAGPPGQGPADPRRRAAYRTSPSAARRPWAG